MKLLALPTPLLLLFLLLASPAPASAHLDRNKYMQIKGSKHWKPYGVTSAPYPKTNTPANQGVRTRSPNPAANPYPTHTSRAKRACPSTATGGAATRATWMLARSTVRRVMGLGLGSG
ncbi:hypothetical protein CC80DRAFT_499704 [Byssothecium circinans]|uniref:Uncharacterized protein n=1 Tax=Byssothecium circinans TaxID=147558 RepID=A0A6A5UMK4_9PLEO|nr:hypothetical protein CC80DRAFT_499704 [Byssothecium circinans]